MKELWPNKPPGAVKKCGSNWPPHAIEGPAPPMAERVKYERNLASFERKTKSVLENSA